MLKFNADSLFVNKLTNILTDMCLKSVATRLRTLVLEECHQELLPRSSETSHSEKGSMPLNTCLRVFYEKNTNTFFLSQK
jgi:hypothetical protein